MWNHGYGRATYWIFYCTDMIIINYIEHSSIASFLLRDRKVLNMRSCLANFCCIAEQRGFIAELQGSGIGSYMLEGGLVEDDERPFVPKLNVWILTLRWEVMEY